MTRAPPPTLMLREWSRATPRETALLRGLRLSGADRERLDSLARRTSLRVEELRQGLLIEVGPHIGVVHLSGLRIVVLPKLRLKALLAMIAYVFRLSDLALTAAAGASLPADYDLADLLGLSLVQQVERIARGGLLSGYRNRQEELPAPRGRIDMGYAATRPKSTVLRCDFHELTTEHLLNQVLAAGLQLAAGLVQSIELGLRLRQAAGRIFGDQQRIRLDSRTLAAANAALDRRSRHYQTALTLVALLFQGSQPAYTPAGTLPLAGFLLDMNRLFERFLTRYLQEHAPEGIEVVSQEVRTDVFAYLENPRGWKQPTLRPDLVFRRHGKTIALGDAKYKNHQQQPPGSEELYQLTTYGLAYPMPGLREVMLFYPLETDESPQPAQLLFTPGGVRERVRIRLVGVPIDAILAGEGWWPPGFAK